MKVLLVNGSPRKQGCTFTALSEVARVLNREGIETQFFQIGTKPVYGCINCRKCRDGLGRCALEDDAANDMLSAMQQADGIIVGSPVYYAGPNGALMALLDRAFFSGAASLAYKPAACVLSCRRGGASASFDRLNKYFTINNMPLVSSQYWNAVHGNTPEEVRQDAEGLQVMRTLGQNMAYLLKALQGRETPRREEQIRTNFIG
ncbi:MAG: flavodoxin family protein [Christensenellales bacterium]|jgi:multimeric flavodoxin WrbA